MDSIISKRHSERVFSGSTFGVTRISMPAGDSLPEHISSQPALIVVLSGKIRYCDTSGQKELEAGATHSIDAHSPHGLIADTESVLLLIR